MKYKNISKSPIYVKSLGRRIELKEEFDSQENDEIVKLMKEGFIKEEIGTVKEDTVKLEKPKKKGKKKQDEDEFNELHSSEDFKDENENL